LLVIHGFLRRLSVREVQAALEETFEEPIVAKSGVARVCRDTRERYRRTTAGGCTPRSATSRPRRTLVKDGTGLAASRRAHS
jgi:hypothetical protein